MSEVAIKYIWLWQ